MLRRVRITRAALATGSAVAVCLAFGTVCSVDRAGLSNVDASASAGGSTGGTLSAAGGHAPGSGGTLGVSGISGTAGATGGGSGGSSSAGGSGGGAGSGSGGFDTSASSGGANGLGGTLGSGGDNPGTGGVSGGGGIGGGSVGAGGDAAGTSGGTAGTGGATGGASGAVGTTGGAGDAGGASGGAGDTGGTTGGAGGIQGSGGRFGTGGAGGAHPPSCASFPAGSTFTPPTDNLLHCYWTHADAVTWESAEATCENEGGTLATILSSQENMAVLSVGLHVMLFAGGADVAWLGATDGKQSNDKSGPGTYAWVTGEPWGFTNWHASQPDGSCTCQNNNTMCACDHWLTIANDGTWYDRDDGTGRPSICEAIAR
jgi:hypothetical protein